MENRNLSGKEKAAYGIGAVGKDMVYMLSASYILYYYQDIMGVSAWVMGIILLIARVFDAFNDPLMGVLVAKTKSRFGRFRPWLFIGTLTNAIILFVMFACPPSLNGSGLVAYAAIFYILWGVTYTMMDIPYWSMVPAFTNGGKERENLSAMARTCAGVGSALITIVTVLAVSGIGNAVSSKQADHQSVTLGSQDALTVYVAELDEAGNATGEVLEYHAGETGMTFEITADAAEFDDMMSFHAENCNYEMKLAGLTLDKENSSMEFAADDLKSGEAEVILYVSGEDYLTIQNSALDMTFTLTSTKEVERIGFKYFSLIIAILFFVFILITCVCIKEKSTVDVKSASVKEMFRALVQNDQAMAMVITIVLVNTATYITSNLLIYFFKYDLGGSNWQGNYTLFNTFGGGIQILSMMLFFPLLRKLFSTMKTFYVAAFSAMIGYVILLLITLVGVKAVYPYLVPGFFIFGAVGVINVLVTVFLANTVDYGEYKNHRRDESVIFSMQTFVVKLASGIAALIASVCLSVFAISESDNTIATVDGSILKGLRESVTALKENGASVVGQSSVVGLRLTMTLIPIVVLLAGLLVFKRKYILTDEKMEEMKKGTV